MRHSSTTSGSAFLITLRSRGSILPPQSSSSLILSSIIRDPSFFVTCGTSSRGAPRLTSGALQGEVEGARVAGAGWGDRQGELAAAVAVGAVGLVAHAVARTAR